MGGMMKKAVTIYTMGMCRILKQEGWLLGTGRERYAQYEAAPFVVFVPKGKRSPRRWQGSYEPYCVVLGGHGLGLTPESGFLSLESNVPGVEIRQSKYTSCDPRYETDFNATLNRFIAEGAEVIADYRHNKEGT